MTSPLLQCLLIGIKASSADLATWDLDGGSLKTEALLVIHRALRCQLAFQVRLVRSLMRFGEWNSVDSMELAVEKVIGGCVLLYIFVDCYVNLVTFISFGFVFLNAMLTYSGWLVLVSTLC